MGVVEEGGSVQGKRLHIPVMGHSMHEKLEEEGTNGTRIRERDNTVPNESS
jgi:hypothetical protein